MRKRREQLSSQMDKIHKQKVDMAESILFVMHGATEVVSIGNAIAFGIQTSPYYMARQFVYLLDYPPAESLNFGIQLARIPQCTYVMLWRYGLVAERQDAVPVLIEAMRNHPQIDFLSGTTKAHDHIYTVQDGEIGFMLARVSAFENLAPHREQYQVDEEEGLVEATRFFTEDDMLGVKRNMVDEKLSPLSDFGALCARQGVRWWEHGGVVCREDPQVKREHKENLLEAQVRAEPEPIAV